MDFQHRVGSKTGGGGVAGWSESNRDRKERLKKLAMETIDINKVNEILDSLCYTFHLPAPCGQENAFFCFRIHIL